MLFDIYADTLQTYLQKNATEDQKNRAHALAQERLDDQYQNAFVDALSDIINQNDPSPEAEACADAALYTHINDFLRQNNLDVLSEHDFEHINYDYIHCPEDESLAYFAARQTLIRRLNYILKTSPTVELQNLRLRPLNF